MGFIDKNIEWIVAMAVINISTLLLDNFCKWLSPSISPLFTLIYYIVLLLMLMYQNKHCGLRFRKPFFIFFFSLYSLYILLYMTTLRVYPLRELHGVPEEIRGFFTLTFLIFGYLLCAETICHKFNMRKFVYLSLFLAVLPTIWYVATVGVGFFHNEDALIEETNFNVLSLSYCNVPILVMSILFYDDLSDNKIVSHLISIFIILVVGYILFMSARRGPLLWCMVNIAICYFYKSRKVFKYIVFASVLGILLYYNIDTVIVWISSVNSYAGERLNAALYEGSTSGRMDMDNQESSIFFLGLNQFLESPLYGSYFRIVTSVGMFRGAYPHNIFIEMLITMGLIGFVMFCILLYRIFKTPRVILMRDNNKLALFSLFMASFLQLQTSDTLSFNIWFWALFYTVLIMNPYKVHKRFYK